MQEQSPEILRLEMENNLLKMQQAHMLEREQYLVYRKNGRPIEPTSSYVIGNLIVGLFWIACAVFLLNMDLWSAEPRLPSREIVITAIGLVGFGLFMPLRAWQKFKNYRDFVDSYISQRQRLSQRYEKRLEEIS